MVDQKMSICYNSGTVVNLINFKRGKKMKKAIVLFMATLVLSVSAYAGYQNCTTRCWGNSCTTSCYSY